MVAMVGGACSGPDPLVYYPGLSYAELARVDEASARAMKDEWYDTFSVYGADLDELRLVEPLTRQLVLRVESVWVSMLNDQFQTGSTTVSPQPGLDPSVQVANLRGLFDSLSKSGWPCEGLDVNIAALNDGTLYAASEVAKRAAPPRSGEPRVGRFRCVSPAGASRARIRFALFPLAEGGPTWSLDIEAPWGQRCKAFPPKVYAAYRIMCEEDDP